MKRNQIALALVLVTVSLFGTTFSQSASYTKNNADQTLRSSGRVNPSTLGMEFQISLGTYPGRGINVPVEINYSSKLWRMEFVGKMLPYNNPVCHSYSIPRFSENLASGWTSSMSIPFIEYTGRDNRFGSNGAPYNTASDPCDANTDQIASYIRRIQIHLPGGESHELRADDTVKSYNVTDQNDTNNANLQANWNTTYYAVDGSNLVYIENSTNGTYHLMLADGSYYDFASSMANLDPDNPTDTLYVRKATSMTDRNGNSISYHAPTTSYPNGYTTDSIGRTLPVPMGIHAPTSAEVDDVNLPGLGGGSNVVNYKLHWNLLKGSSSATSGLTDFSQSLCYAAGGYPYPGSPQPPTGSCALFQNVGTAWTFKTPVAEFNPVVLTEVELPNGTSYKFSYDLYGRINKVIYPTGGAETFQYTVIPALTPTSLPDNDINAQVNFGVTQRQVVESNGATPLVWTYSSTGTMTRMVRPDGTKSERYIKPDNTLCLTCTNGTYGYGSGLTGMVYEEREYTSGTTDNLISKKLTTWTTTQLTVGPNNAITADWHPRVTQEESIVYDSAGNGVSTTTKYEYEGDLSTRTEPVLQKRVKQYGFVVAGSSPPSSPLRTTESTFLINDPNYSSSQDGYRSRNMVGLVTVSKMFDSSGTNIVGQSETVYDESGRSQSYRGNPTTARVWDSTKGPVTSSSNFVATHGRFDDYGNLYESTDALGNTTTTTFDSTNHLFPISVTTPVADPNPSSNPDGIAHGSNTAFTTYATFDPATGLPLTTKDANGLRTEITYDSATLRPRFVKNYVGDTSTQVGGTTETIYHDETGNLWVKSKSQIDDTHFAESTAYLDGLGRTYKTEQLNSHGNIFTEKAFDAEGRVSGVCSPYRSGETKHWTTNVYDITGRIIEVDLPDTSTIKTTYGVSTSAPIGVTKTITDQAGKTRSGYTDALGNMVRVVEDPSTQNHSGQSLSTDYVFDTLGHLRKTTQGEQNRYFMHDSLGRLLYAKQPEQETNSAFSATDPITGNTAWTVKYEYNDSGNITKTTDAKGGYVQATYDHLNRIIFRDYSDTATPDVSFFYDGRGLASVPDFANGKTTKVTSSASETRTMSFDIFGRTLTQRQTTDGHDYDTAYTYNLGGALIDETYPSGRVVRNTLDENGELEQVQSRRDANHGFVQYANSFTRDAAGNVTKMQLGNGRWETAVYNSRQQVTQIGLGTTDSTQDLLKLNYDYGTATQNNGLLREQRINFTGLSSEIKQAYVYDDLNRLKSSTETYNGTTQSWIQTFNYDRYGNRTFDADNTSTLSGSVSWKVTNPKINTSDNRLKKDQDNDGVTDYDFDKNGNLTLDAQNQRFVYDAENHQKQFFSASNNTSTPDATYTFDGDGKRVKKEVATGEVTIFVYDAGGQAIAEYSTQVAQTPKVSYLTDDHLGSPRIITDENGAVISRHDYTGFGVDIAETYGAIGGRTPAQEYGVNDRVREQYTGYRRDDESGLEYAGARFYNTAHGRFTSADPLIASAAIRNPQTLNRYSYVLNSPYKFTDPLGLVYWEASGACGSTCPGSGGQGGGGALSGALATGINWSLFNWTAEVIGYVIDQPDGSKVVNGLVIPSSVVGALDGLDTSQGNAKLNFVYKDTVYNYSSVDGAEAGDAVMNTKDAVAAAFRKDHKDQPDFNCDQTGGGCTYADFKTASTNGVYTITVSITVYLTKWTGYASADSFNRAGWDAYAYDTKTHEDVHALIYHLFGGFVGNSTTAKTSKELLRFDSKVALAFKKIEVIHNAFDELDVAIRTNVRDHTFNKR